MCVCARIEWIYVNYDAKWSFAVIKAVNIYETQSLNTSCFCECVSVESFKSVVMNQLYSIEAERCVRWFVGAQFLRFALNMTWLLVVDIECCFSVLHCVNRSCEKKVQRVKHLHFFTSESRVFHILTYEVV